LGKIKNEGTGRIEGKWKVRVKCMQKERKSRQKEWGMDMGF
jgi:hypothetical protein